MAHIRAWKIVLLTVTLLSFQNCGQFATDGGDRLSFSALSSSSTSVRASEDAKIYSKNRIHVVGRASYFFVDPKLFGNGAGFYWENTLTGSAAGCERSNPTGTPRTLYIVQCARPGKLNVDLQVLTEDYRLIRISFAETEVHGAGDFAGIPVLDDNYVYLPNDELPFIPNDHEEVVVDPVTLTGAQLYTNNCARCHGPLGTSTRKGSGLTSIKSAIQSVPVMSSLNSLTNAELAKIADALK